MNLQFNQALGSGFQNLLEKKGVGVNASEDLAFVLLLIWDLIQSLLKSS